MKKIFAILAIFILLSTPVLGLSVYKNPLYSKGSFLDRQNNILHSRFGKLIKNKFDVLKESISSNKVRRDFYDFTFSPENITLEDDAFHGADKLHFIEWWYFDTCLDDGYSIQLSINVYDVLSFGLVVININVYKNGDIKATGKEIYNLNNFNMSKEIPLIELDGKKIMEGFIEEKTGDFIYALSLDINEIYLDLRFTSLTEGWKGNTSFGEWAVIMPKAGVDGIIKIGDNDFYHNVKGFGYHDHNWNVTILAGINFGWIWGKVNSNNYTVIWSDILTTWYLDDPLIVVNKENEGYVNINPEDIQIIIKDVRFENGMLIPCSFSINVWNKNISFSVEVKVLETHYASIMGLVNYWRYHVRYTGSITVCSKTENIDEKNVAEFIRFRPY